MLKLARKVRRAGLLGVVIMFVLTLAPMTVHAADEPLPAPHEPTADQQWHAAIVEIMSRDGVDETTANQRLANLLVWHDAVNTIVLRDGISWDQAARNLARFLARVEESGGVDRWQSLALVAGWPAELWGWQRCIIARESHGNPNAWNRADPAGGSMGLMQINGGNIGFLRNQGIAWSRADLFDPLTNLRAGWALYQHSGPGPWSSRKRC